MILCIMNTIVVKWYLHIFFAMLPIMNKSCKMSAANYGSVFSNKKHSDIISKHVSVSYALCLINVTLIEIYTILHFAWLFKINAIHCFLYKEWYMGKNWTPKKKEKKSGTFFHSYWILLNSIRKRWINDWNHNICSIIST